MHDQKDAVWVPATKWQQQQRRYLCYARYQQTNWSQSEIWNSEEGMQLRKVPCNGWWIGHLSAPKHPAQVFKACLQLGFSSNLFSSTQIALCFWEATQDTSWQGNRLKAPVAGADRADRADRDRDREPLQPRRWMRSSASMPQLKGSPSRGSGSSAKLKQKIETFPNKFCLSILWHDNWSHWVVFSNWISVSFRLSIREMKRTNSMPKRFGSTSRDATGNGAAAWYRVVRMIIFHNVIMYSGFKHIECIDL